MMTAQCCTLVVLHTSVYSAMQKQKALPELRSSFLPPPVTLPQSGVF